MSTALSSACPACLDIHTHVVPRDFPRYAGKHQGARWPSMAAGPGCHRHVMLDGSVYRTVNQACWDMAARRDAMQDRQTTGHVLSPMPELLSYWLAPDDGLAMCRYLNDQIAMLAAFDPGRFHGLGAVPLQDVDAACRELEHVARTGLAGVEIGTNVQGVPIGDARFLPFFQTVRELDLAVFVHPLRPVGTERLVGPAGLAPLLAFPGETGLAAASLMTCGLPARVPGLRIAFSHGGGTLAMLLPRLQHGWETFEHVRAAMAASPREMARAFFYDSLVYDRDALRHLVTVFGETQVCVGSDFPFRIAEPRPRERVLQLGLDADTTEKMLHGNARRWLGGTRPSSPTSSPTL
ncbi:amidohydrolase [Verticiella sediminum]|uniref:2-amino-3-carboxymuconate-6-semialdehyde decarboxylase n=1 Tax=Verticiella sediminum TaxID=1247510 RepID=A0A556ANR5_9BURK|nr:amidohydrolase family protein [Verticiella sediminum]TSH94524.1 amidohydrolase [Verticiella sediminum]